MKRLSILMSTLVCLLVSCESTSYRAPLVTAEMAKVGARQHLDPVMLRQGRTLFVSRCIECHTLPVVSRYKATRWPGIVDEMAERASLKQSERDALLAYLLAAHSASDSARKTSR